MRQIKFLVFLVLLGCNRASHSVEEAVEAVGYAPAAVNDLAEGKTTSSISPIDYNRKIIKNASLNFEDNNPQEKIEFLTQLVGKNKGYIISNSHSKMGENIAYHINFKIPSTSFETVIPSIEKNCGTLIEKNISSDDVTEEFYDNESQLKAKKELESRYLQLVKQAKSIKDMLELEAKLSEVRTTIEQIEGRQRYLNNNTQYSTFDITIIDRQSTIGNHYLSRIWKSLGKGMDCIFLAFLWFIEILPFIVIIWGIYSLIKKRKINLNIFRRKKEDKKDESNG